ncbi:MAG: molybdate ABC transporter substrate-binding protein [Maritimibacter sp.]|nr:molybdate ABC transporter substrate-binding protein [Maritimibacter sp.]
MRRILRLFALIALVAAPARAEDVVVFAAASLKTALDEIAAQIPAATGHRLVVSYAGSSQLARQILLGAPADIFLSANTGWMDALEAEGRVAPGTRGDLLGNRLVLVAHDPEAGAIDLSDPAALPARLSDGHLAMALVDAVPAGQYGRAALTALGLWDAVAPQVAQSDNVRAALALVVTGAAPLGVVYGSDAIAEPRVRVVATFPEDSHPPIVYPMAVVAGRARAATEAVSAHLRGPAARAVFEVQGFTWLGS